MSQVDPKKVQEFLNVNNTAVDSPAETVLNLEDLKTQVEDAKNELMQSNENVEQERSKIFEPYNEGITSLNAWAHTIDNSPVEVSDQDKSLYFKSLLNDAPLELDIKMDVQDGITLTFKSLTNNDFEIVFAALSRLSDENKIPGTSQYATKVQQCAVALQLVKYNNNVQGNVKLDSSASVQSQVDTLLNYVDGVIANWSWPKWQLVVTALRVFETKLAICNENIRNGNFWKPADSN
jgi:hypothetical protein